MATPKIIADFETQLATAVAVGGTSFTLTSATDDDGVALPSGLYYFTVDNGSNQKEYLSGTLSGTTVSSVVSVSRQGVETSGAVRAHRVGASVIISDWATYKKYIDGATVAGASDADATTKGVVEIATQSEVDAKTATGGTLASLAVRPDTMRATKYNDYVADTGAANAYVITPAPAITAYAAGQTFTFKATNANTTASTLNVNALGVKTIKKGVSTDLASGDIAAGQIVVVTYDGTNFILVSNPSPTKSVVSSLLANTGLTSRDISAASGTATFAHGLASTPTKVMLRAVFGNGAGYSSISIGTWYVGDKLSSTTLAIAEGGSTAVADATDLSNSYALRLSYNNAGNLSTDYQTCTVSADATNITLTWTKVGTPTGTHSIIWEAECLATTLVTA